MHIAYKHENFKLSVIRAYLFYSKHEVGMEDSLHTLMLRNCQKQALSFLFLLKTVMDILLLVQEQPLQKNAYKTS